MEAAVDLAGPFWVRAGTLGVVVQVSPFGGSATVVFAGARQLVGLRPSRDLRFQRQPEEGQEAQEK